LTFIFKKFLTVQSKRLSQFDLMDLMKRDSDHAGQLEDEYQKTKKIIADKAQKFHNLFSIFNQST